MIVPGQEKCIVTKELMRQDWRKARIDPRDEDTAIKGTEEDGINEEDVP